MLITSRKNKVAWNLDVFCLAFSKYRAVLSDKGLTLETSSFESLYGGQFTLSPQLIKRNYLILVYTKTVDSVKRAR